MSERGRHLQFEVLFTAEGHNASKFRNDITVDLCGAHPRTDYLPSDEGVMHGGDGTAPYPLAYFTSGLTACIMTQLRAFSKRLRIHVTDIRVNTTCRWQAQQYGTEPYESQPDGFTLDITLDGDATVSDKKRLIACAAKGCFIEVALKPGVVKHRLRDGENWIELD